MNLRKTIIFILQAVAVGLAAGLLLLLFLPERFATQSEVVEVQHNHDTPAKVVTATGPVSYAEAVKRAAPAVVNIYTRTYVNRNADSLFGTPLVRRYFDNNANNANRGVQNSLGSGVIVSEQGYVLTNNHVIENADEIEILLHDNSSVRAQLVGSDPETDLAVLKMEATSRLPSITVGSSANLQVGDVVLAIGNPFNVGQTVTQGIISATGRDRLGLNTFENFIQTDAAINSGNSGGALINAFGELIGINTALFSRSGGSQGIGFAIPVDLAYDVMTQIIQNGRVIRGWLGVQLSNISPQIVQTLGLQNTEGVLIAGVIRNGPAQRAGIEPGDIITHIDGQPINDARHALLLIAHHKPGDALDIRGLRREERIDTKAQVGQRPMTR